MDCLKALWPLMDCAIYLAGLFLLTWGGNIVCRTILTWSGITLPPAMTTGSANLHTSSAPQPPLNAAPTPTPPPTPAPTQSPSATSGRAGRVIGSLERLIIMTGLVAGSWEIIAAVIALKTVGRFKELDERLHAEYFLIGSLASIVWATLITLVMLRFDNTWGFHIADLLREAKAK